MNEHLFLHQMISNDPIDMDIFNLLIKKSSHEQFYDAAFVQRLSSLINSDSSHRQQFFLFDSLESIVTNYAFTKNKKKESKLGNFDFSFNLLGLCLMKKAMLNLYLEGKFDIVIENPEAMKKNVELNIQELLPYYQDKQTCFKMKKYDLQLNILEMGYLILDNEMIDLGMQLNQSIQASNVKHILKNFIYHENKIGFQVLKKQNYLNQFLNSQTDEQKFLFILNASGEIDLSTAALVSSNLKSQLNYISTVMHDLGIHKIDGTLMSTALFDYIDKNHPTHMILNLPVTYELIDYFLVKHAKGDLYTNNVIFKLTNYTNGVDYLRSKEISFTNDINEILTKEFRQKGTVAQVFKSVLALINAKSVQSINVFSDIDLPNFKLLIENLEYNPRMVNDEYLSVIFDSLKLDLNTVLPGHNVAIQGVSKAMSLGNMAGVMCMNQGYIKSFESLVEKGMQLDSVVGAESSILDVIAKRKKSGIIYNNIVEKYKLSSIMASGEDTIKKRVKL